MFRPERRRRPLSHVLWGALATSTLACGGGQDPVPVVDGIIDRETFISVYVDLRAAAIQSPDLELSDEARLEVLARHDVDEDNLIGFVDAYGRELDYMSELWAEVERRIEAAAASPGDQNGTDP